MQRLRFVLAFFFLFSIVAGIPGSVRVAMAADPESAGFVSGNWRIIAHQASLVDEDSSIGLSKGDGSQFVIIADVTNIGTSVATLDVGDFKIADSTAAKVDAGQTADVHRKLKYVELDIAGSIGLTEDETQRIALVFSGISEAEEAGSLVFGDQELPLEFIIKNKITVAHLEAVPTWAVSQTIVANAELNAVEVPSVDDCYGAESATAIQDMTGGTVWVETDGQLDWYWDASAGQLVPLQATLVTTGLGGHVANDSGVFRPWLESLTDRAKKEKTGLWATCKDARGTWVNPPTPAPPTAEELRANYQWIDVRDLAIRPHTFEGEKIALEGEVFTIDAEEGFTGIQIWVTTPTGDIEPVVVAYYGDLIGVYEGTWVVVYGTGAGTFEGTNGFGAAISQPMILADIVDY